MNLMEINSLTVMNKAEELRNFNDPNKMSSSLKNHNPNNLNPLTNNSNPSKSMQLPIKTARKYSKKILLKNHHRIQKHPSPKPSRTTSSQHQNKSSNKKTNLPSSDQQISTKTRTFPTTITDFRREKNNY